MKAVYLNRELCNYFQGSYFGRSSMFIAASALLQSNKEWDSKHRSFLKGMGGKIIHISREGGDEPGWFQVLKPSP